MAGETIDGKQAGRTKNEHLQHLVSIYDILSEELESFFAIVYYYW